MDRLRPTRRGAISLLTVLSLVRPAAAAEGWVERSNEHAQVLVEVMARFAPEVAGFFGVDGLDEQVTQVPLDANERQNRAVGAALAELQRRLAAESDPAVRQDLEILVQAAAETIETNRVQEQHLLPYFALHQTIFQGIRALLDDQVAAERRPAALVRLRKYAGLEPGFTPLTKQVEAYVRARFDRPGTLGPFEGEVKKDLGNAPRFVAGIEQLFQKYEIAGYEEPYAALRAQLAEFETFLTAEVMPRARQDFRLPAEVYADNLRNVGVDMPVDELVSRAKVSFREIQNEMQAIAERLAADRGYPSSDYRAVIRELKKEQLVGDAILPHYEARNAELEKIVAREKVVSLPDRSLRIRLASEAESAETPAPNMRPPRLLGNTGEMGEFVLPLRIPSEGGGEEVGFDDFTFAAASWTLSVHEARPGHEMQFASIVEAGVSIARGLFALNSVNAEGWALYMEAEMKPYLPLEGQLVSLQHRLLRSARAFLDPGLQLGRIDRDTAFRVLEQEVVLSHAMALQEVERYTFWAPGQATAYFCGYQRLMEMRTDAERLLGDRFDRRAYHDFLLAQGLLPPRLLKKAVTEQFVPAHGG